MKNHQDLDLILKQAVERHEVHGVAATVATERGVVYEGGFGECELGTQRPMNPDTVFWAASMTKAITATAAMQLVERGSLNLDTPASDILPALAKIQVLEGFSSADQPILRALRRPVSLRHLLTHTAGFGYEFLDAKLVKYHQLTGIPALLNCENATFDSPLLHDPGDRWTYDIGIDWAGKMVEQVSGKRLRRYLYEELLAPLGMQSTSFILEAGQRARLAGMHARGAEGDLSVITFEMPQEPEYDMGGGGLYSTVQDYLRFTQMIMNDGLHGGRRILKAETVAEMARPQLSGMDCGRIKSLAPAYFNDVDFYPGMAMDWGLSFSINGERTPQGRSAGSLSWGGLPNGYYWIDRKRRITAVLAVQILPFFDGPTIKLFRAFENAVNKIY